MEAWDIIVLGDGPAALRAASTAAESGTSVLMMTTDSLGSGHGASTDGIAAPIKESTMKSHSDDTIRAGNFLCDQDIVTQRISLACRQVDLLERWGVIFRRYSDGIPLVRRAAGHTLPRLATAGDALAREVQQVLEEQCMRHGVIRRGDQIPLNLVHTDQEVHGLIVLDLSTGKVNALQAKSVIIADGGYEGIWQGNNIGLGIDLAMQTGLSVRNMEFTALTPLSITGTNVTLPIGMLADGATIHEPNGNPLAIEDFADPCQISMAVGNNGYVLDARNMGDSNVWWAQTMEIVSTRLGIDMKRQTVPISAQVYSTLGGIVTDEHGRAISGKWSRWFTGLYAAGSSASSGVHGAGIVAGNHLLDSMVGGYAAGSHAVEYCKTAKFTGKAQIETYLGVAEADLDLDMESVESGPVQRTGPLFAKLGEIMNSNVGLKRSGQNLASALEMLEALSIDAEKVHLDDKSRLFNTNLLESIRLKAGIRLAIATVQSAISREESRGTHQRTDFVESDEESLHHSLVDKDGNTSTLAIRKGSSGTWILAPDA